MAIPSRPCDGDRRIPGPSLARLLWTVVAERGDRIGVMRRLARKYGDLVQFRLFDKTLVICTGPADVREILVRQQRQFDKGLVYARVRRLLGDGLVTADGEEHRRQRQPLQHLFTHKRIDEHAPTLVATARTVSDSWRPGQALDVGEVMRTVALVNAAECFFHVDARTQAPQLLRAAVKLVAELEKFDAFTLRFARVRDRLPLPSARRWRVARREALGIVDGWIERRLAERERPDDVLTVLVAGLEEGGDGPAQRLETQQHALGFLLAGAATTANTMASTWAFLARHAAAERALHDEVDAVLAGRVPELADLERMPSLYRLSQETMRLVPPVSSFSRSPRCPIDLGGGRISEGASVSLSPRLVQRDERFFADAESFRPDRWASLATTGAREGTYFPFALGGRRCIGERFAWLEMQLTLAVIAQRWRLRMDPEVARQVDSCIDLLPDFRLPAVVEARR